MIPRAHGLKAWLVQRVSAVYMALYLFYFIFSLAAFPIRDYEGWRGFITAPSMSTATLVFLLALLTHAWVGVRDVVLDYVRIWPLRMTLLSVVAVALIACGAWAMRVLMIGGL